MTADEVIDALDEVSDEHENETSYWAPGCAALEGVYESATLRRIADILDAEDGDAENP